MKGERFTLSSLQGKLVLLDFWATWCAPCVAELPLIAKLHKKHGHRDDFVIVSVSLDWDEKLLRKFIDERKMTWPQVFGETPAGQTIIQRYGVSAIPAVFLIGPDGRLAASDLMGATLEQTVEAALKGEVGK
jgi:thiol-disulfide isomerase/thioredoxin